MLTGAKPIDLLEAEEAAEESSNSTQGLDSFIQDSVSLSQNKDLHPLNPNVQAQCHEAQQANRTIQLRQQEEVKRNIMLLNSLVVIDSNCNLRAS
ncbi:hypothetical protein RHMOL_Rhmol08G0158200 [Rhododendron molle]|uniref:Uncharacterized protein n=1 Tax=Rhododendron molle TaxID=49168 RepID=A0ACC0MPZ4_RHOML|nr:hypothetical protein RHMOL_Rhmol08G0158200 [Rhododendron molle]